MKKVFAVILALALCMNGTAWAYSAADTSIYVGEEGLTSIDVTPCTELDYLGCQQNKLTSLDVSKNTVLTALDCAE
ncbi:MAG: hypothetical protein IKS52_11255, partial [Clostridia bacterium]|nr:hypothetical protein [Clostridia bacterium]